MRALNDEALVVNTYYSTVLTHEVPLMAFLVTLMSTICLKKVA